MRSVLVLMVLVTSVDAQPASPFVPKTPPKPAVPSGWRDVAAIPNGARATDLPSHSEPADGFCPPRAEVFEIDKQRAIVTREPCSRTTRMSLRTPKGERTIGADVYGATGSWHGVRVNDRTAVMIFRGSGGSTGTLDRHAILFVIDLATTNTTSVMAPGVDEPTIDVVGGEVYASGGTYEIQVGVRKPCSNGNGPCDPIMKRVPNTRIWAYKVK